MSVKSIEKGKKLEKRKKRTKYRTVGKTDRPRLFVYKSLRHIYAQIIDDKTGKTLGGISDLNSQVKAELSEKDTKKSVAFKVGKAIAKIALQKDIKRVVFDRGGFLYHGRIKELAEGARKGGLEF